MGKNNLREPALRTKPFPSASTLSIVPLRSDSLGGSAETGLTRSRPIAITAKQVVRNIVISLDFGSLRKKREMDTSIVTLFGLKTTLVKTFEVLESWLPLDIPLHKG